MTRNATLRSRAIFALGINIAGPASTRLGEPLASLRGCGKRPRSDQIDLAMQGHEAAADFKFTTSRHFVGRLRPLADFIESDAD